MASTISTVNDLVGAALVDSGVVGQGQTPSPEDANKAWLITNLLAGQWNRKRWLIWHLIDVSKVSTGALSYTIGPGGDFNVPRPDRLEDGNFARQITVNNPQQVDYPLHLIESREDYNRIVLKTMGTFPNEIFYDSAYPLGNVFVWPIPQAGLYEIHLALKDTIPLFTSLPQSIVLPPEHQAALYYNVIVRLRAAYQLPADPVMVSLARESLNVIRGANTQIPTSKMPRQVLNNRRAAYNVFSDQP